MCDARIARHVYGSQRTALYQAAFVQEYFELDVDGRGVLSSSLVAHRVQIFRRTVFAEPRNQVQCSSSQIFRDILWEKIELTMNHFNLCLVQCNIYMYLLFSNSWIRFLYEACSHQSLHKVVGQHWSTLKNKFKKCSETSPQRVEKTPAEYKWHCNPGRVGFVKKRWTRLVTASLFNRDAIGVSLVLII